MFSRIPGQSDPGKFQISGCRDGSHACYNFVVERFLDFSFAVREMTVINEGRVRVWDFYSPSTGFKIKGLLSAESAENWQAIVCTSLGSLKFLIHRGSPFYNFNRLTSRGTSLYALKETRRAGNARIKLQMAPSPELPTTQPLRIRLLICVLPKFRPRILNQSESGIQNPNIILAKLYSQLMGFVRMGQMNSLRAVDAKKNLRNG
jgi:hypothetical protein